MKEMSLLAVHIFLGGSAFYTQPTAYGYYGMMPGWGDSGMLPSVPQHQFHPGPQGTVYPMPDSLFRLPGAPTRHVRGTGGSSAPSPGPNLLAAPGGIETVRPSGYFLVSPSGPAVATPAAQIVHAAAAAASAAVAQVVPMVPHSVIPAPMADFGTLAVGPFYFGAGEIGVVGGPTFTVAGSPEPQPVGVSQRVIEQCTETRVYHRPDASLSEGMSTRFMHLELISFRSISGEEDRCTVCLSEYQVEERVRTLQCAHIFHMECIDRWLILNKKCPICRVEVDRGCPTAQRTVAQSPEVMITFETRGHPFITTPILPAPRPSMAFPRPGFQTEWTEQ